MELRSDQLSDMQTSLGKAFIESFGKLSRSQYNDLLQAHAAANPDFREAIKRDFVGTMKELAHAIAGDEAGQAAARACDRVLKGVKVTVLEETPSQKYLVLENGDLP